jgi:hypothetical protein
VRRRFLLRAAPVSAAVFVAAFLGGCAAYSGTPAQKVQQWAKHSSFVADNTTLVNDVIRTREAVKVGTVKQVRTICGGFASDVGNSYVTLPTPDQALTNDLNAADVLLVDASTACSGVSSVSSSVMKTALMKMTSGLAYLGRAQERIESFGVAWNVRL